MTLEQVKAEFEQKLPDNTTQLISPADVRDPLIALMVILIALDARVTALEDD